MARRAEAIVGPARSKVTQVDHQGILNRSGVNPAFVLVPDLEAAAVVLHQERDRAPVRVLATALFARSSIRRLWRLTKDAKRGSLLLTEGIEALLGKLGCQREPAHDPSREWNHLVVVRLESFAQLGKIVGPEVPPAVPLARNDAWVVARKLSSDPETLLDVGWCTGLEPLTAYRLIATVADEVTHIERQFLVERFGKEAACTIKDRLT